MSADYVIERKAVTSPPTSGTSGEHSEADAGRARRQLVTRARAVGLDRLRGAAMLLMLTDHLLYLAGDTWGRATVGRLALPIFFIVAGHLAGRVNAPRLIWAAALGLSLPVVVPWIDDPNVLLWYALFAPAVVFARRLPAGPFVLLGLSLTLLANGYFDGFPASYPPAALLGLMALGALVPRELLTRAGDKLPAWFSFVGRYPLSFYAGHLLALELIRPWLS